MKFLITINQRGFSLVELMVVLAIIATLSTSAVLGFGYLGELLKAREISGFVGDVVKREELKILRGDFDQTTIYFYPDFVAVESARDEDGVGLSVGNSCTDGRFLVYGQDGNLTKRDENNAILQIKGVNAGQECIAFVPAEELEWSYQLSSGGDSSPVVRFVHFNLDREFNSESFQIVQNAGARVMLSAPYAKKQLYDSLNNSLTQLDLTVEDSSGRSTADITIL